MKIKIKLQYNITNQQLESIQYKMYNFVGQSNTSNIINVPADN